MVVMENAIWLPGLPEVTLESNARVVNDSVVVGVQQNDGEWN